MGGSEEVKERGEEEASGRESCVVSIGLHWRREVRFLTALLQGQGRTTAPQLEGEHTRTSQSTREYTQTRHKRSTASYRSGGPGSCCCSQHGFSRKKGDGGGNSSDLPCWRLAPYRPAESRTATLLAHRPRYCVREDPQQPQKSSDRRAADRTPRQSPAALTSRRSSTNGTARLWRCAGSKGRGRASLLRSTEVDSALSTSSPPKITSGLLHGVADNGKRATGRASLPTGPCSAPRVELRVCGGAETHTCCYNTRGKDRVSAALISQTLPLDGRVPGDRGEQRRGPVACVRPQRRLLPSGPLLLPSSHLSEKQHLANWGAYDLCRSRPLCWPVRARRVGRFERRVRA